ncbi:GNAT family N-acetyltransferase [Shewanella maritima]|uniref:GNAT family N-acetyltransferase n=1 Tax=Shewanella maritima TaxID=2520507 RepID=UPI003736C07A
MNIELIQDDLEDGAVISLLDAHLKQMHQYSPIDSIHALEPDKLRAKSLTFWSARINDEIAACIALKQLDDSTGEIKSMKTSHKFLRKGIAEKLLTLVINESEQRGYGTLYLETGCHQAFTPAIKLYKKYGFVECDPFGSYQLDPYSLFFVKRLGTNELAK